MGYSNDFFKYDTSNRNSCDEIDNGWECNNKWNKIKEQTVSTEWVTSAKLLKCIEIIMNSEKNENNLAICGVCIEGMHRGITLFNQALGAQYKEGTIISVSGSMTPEYFKRDCKINTIRWKMR